jgi:hypothetical protein
MNNQPTRGDYVTGRAPGWGWVAGIVTDLYTTTDGAPAAWVAHDPEDLTRTKLVPLTTVVVQPYVLPIWAVAQFGTKTYHLARPATLVTDCGRRMSFQAFRDSCTLDLADRPDGARLCRRCLGRVAELRHRRPDLMATYFDHESECDTCAAPGAARCGHGAELHARCAELARVVAARDTAEVVR